MTRYSIITAWVCMTCLSATAQVNLFTDSFDRSIAQENDIDASSAGMSGLAAPMSYVERGDDVIINKAWLTNIENHRLHLADGNNMSTLYLEHNFTAAEIPASGGMTVGLTIVSNDGNATDRGRWCGLGVGNTLAECQTAEFDHRGPGFRGQDYNGLKAGTSDIYVSWSPYNGGILNIYKNGPTAAGGEGIDLAAGALTGNDRLEMELMFGDFNAGSTVYANILWNSVVVHSTTFEWDHTNANYIGICSRQDIEGFTVDDLTIETLADDPEPAISQFEALPYFVHADQTSAAVTLRWDAAFLPAGSTYAITADKAVTFPHGDETGAVDNGETSVEVVVDGTQGAVAFTVTIYDGATAIASTTTEVQMIPEQDPETPNFIVIFTDDQGWGTTSVQVDPEVPASKSDFFETPNIERLAEQGIRFTQAYSSHANCSPSRAALLTGRSPAALHFTDIVGRNSGVQYEGNPMIPASHINDLPTGALTIPELLKQHNAAYMAAHFGKWHLRGGGPENHGFDASDGATGNSQGSGTPPDDPKQVFGIAQRGNDWMETQVVQGRPFYLQLSHYATHLPILHLAETKDYFDAKTPGARHQHSGFAAMLKNLDVSIGQVLDKVAELGIQDNTYIIYTADNGTYPLDIPENINGPIRGWKATIWEGGVRVPFIVIGPGIAGDTISREPVVGYDILPTICEMAGIDLPTLPPLVEGGSFAHILTGGSGPVMRAQPGLVFHWPHYQNAKFSTPDSTLLLEGYKLHYRWETNKLQLFHLEEDLAETTDLACRQKSLAEQMARTLHQHLDTIGARRPTPNPDYTPVCWDPAGGNYPPDDFMGRDPSPYDFDGDCIVALNDFGMMTAGWLQNDATYDLNGNGMVDLSDFVGLTCDWLQCYRIPVGLGCQ